MEIVINEQGILTVVPENSSNSKASEVNKPFAPIPRHIFAKIVGDTETLHMLA